MILTTRPHLKYWLYTVFVISISLRLILGSVNNGSANDDHLTVSRIIVQTGALPEPQDCWQCYHPKLYHYTVAKLWQCVDATSEFAQTRIAQLLNVFAGIVCLFVFWSFIKKQNFPNYVKLLCFTLLALNPRLIAINVQASNDTFVILFGTIILYSLYEIFKQPSVKYSVLLIVFTLLAGITKTNAIIFILGVILVLLIKIVLSRNYSISLRSGYIGFLVLYICLSVVFIAWFGEYYSNYVKYGRPTVYNTETGDLPYFFEETNFRRPGVQSVLGGYFTFRIIDMIEHPIITNDENIYPKHRTSVWSQLYGRTHFIFFDDWPAGKWQCRNADVLWCGRLAFVLAFFPSLLFAIVLFMQFRIWFSLKSNKIIENLKNTHTWIFHPFIFGFLLFLILFTLIGRDFSFIKVIYLFPALLAAIPALLKSCDIIYHLTMKNGRLFVFWNFSVVLLLLAYILPIVYLIAILT